ncbi:hemolysin XhlA [Rhodobacter aestuarii]|uniref:Haemolysin XhlA n=1 Tax=Rhodobacter aestuarii TaxID=453582 RepID=A0A1N7Q2J4_9RHOB|nr:hemolysin XhlA family protein [Rhodobacter aestuarii]PTV94034.1 hemolysin XhlA [Rhodobacter aestuarii]SIT16827.1 Haemolysin XhlA [Rhodobacter aestuarii]
MTDVPGHIPSHFADSLNRAHLRLDGHEERIRKIELDGATMAEWRNNTTDKLDSIRSSITWLIRLIIGGLVAAAITFVVSGGLNGTQ